MKKQFLCQLTSHLLHITPSLTLHYYFKWEIFWRLRIFIPFSLSWLITRLSEQCNLYLECALTMNIEDMFSRIALLTDSGNFQCEAYWDILVIGAKGLCGEGDCCPSSASFLLECSFYVSISPIKHTASLPALKKWNQTTIDWSFRKVSKKKKHIYVFTAVTLNVLLQQREANAFSNAYD